MSKKTLCQWDSKKIEEKKEKFISKINNSKFYCHRCGRSANEEENLCKPELINENKEDKND